MDAEDRGARLVGDRDVRVHERALPTVYPLLPLLSTW